MDESPTPVLDVLLHPIRWRIVQRALGREVTTTDLKRDLPDIPTTTLYRHVAALIDAGYLTVVRERKIRGTTERTLSLDQTKVGRIDERSDCRSECRVWSIFREPQRIGSGSS